VLQASDASDDEETVDVVTEEENDDEDKDDDVKDELWMSEKRHSGDGEVNNYCLVVVVVANISFHVVTLSDFVTYEVDKICCFGWLIPQVTNS